MHSHCGGGALAPATARRTTKVNESNDRVTCQNCVEKPKGVDPFQKSSSRRRRSVSVGTSIHFTETDRRPGR
jgi:hypothetical protein